MTGGHEGSIRTPRVNERTNARARAHTHVHRVLRRRLCNSERSLPPREIIYARETLR